MNWLNFIEYHWIEALVVGAIGLLAVVIGRLVTGKSLGKLKVSQYFFGFLLIAFLYLLSIATGILDPIGFSLDLFRPRAYNLIPFSQWLPKQFALNAILFVPLGFLLPLVFRFPKRRVALKVFLISFGVSLFIELTQLFMMTRSFDVNDLLANTLGGIAGYGIYRLIFSGRKRS